MNPLALGGFVVAIGGIIFVIISAGASPASLWETSSFVLVFGGTVGVTMMTMPGDDVINAAKLMSKAFSTVPREYGATINLFVELAEQARREGLLSLEERIAQIDNPFIQKGMQLLVDGTDPNVIQDMLETDIDQLSARHARHYAVFETMGAYSPTMGMLGTVMGIIFTLANLTTPSEIGAKVAIAFITTLYGVVLANMVYLPIGGRLKQMSKAEISERELALQGMLAVQAGDNPQIVRQKLEAFLPNNARGLEEPETA
jgi:chemotaxis protein MotA